MKKLLKENDTILFVTIAILVTLILTWIIPGGSFSGTEFVKGDMTKLGLEHLATSSIYSFSFFLQQIIFVLLLGAFYGVISMTNGYKELVSRCAKFVKGKEIPVVLIVSLLISIFVSISSQSFIAMIAIPFIITVLLNANLDKKTAFIATFGSIFIGIIGATYGTEGFYYFSYYLGSEVKTALSTRAVVLAVAYVIFSIFNVLSIKKVLAGKKVDETKEDRFAVSKPSKKKVKVWPIVLLLVIVAAYAVLGYIRWEEQFGITCFAEFHDWLMGLSIGKYKIFALLLGNVVPFGTWELYSMFSVFAVVMVIAAIIYKVSVDDVVDGISNGLSKMAKPAALMVLAYSVFVMIYWSPIIPTIINKILKPEFNILTSMIASTVSSVFVADFGFTGYTIGSFLSTAYVTNLKSIMVIYPAMYGFIQMIAPTSVILLAGLSYANVSYKEWIKHIWKFVLILLAALLIVFALI